MSNVITVEYGDAPVGGGGETGTITVSTSGTSLPINSDSKMVVVDVTTTSNTHNLYVWFADTNTTSAIANYKTPTSAGAQEWCYNTTTGGIIKSGDNFTFKPVISNASEGGQPATYYACSF